MRNPVGSSSHFIFSNKQRALLAAAFLTLGPIAASISAQTDLATIRAAADRGEPDAMNALANAYANGQGVPVNVAEALHYYQLAAGRGLAPAQFNVGMMYELGRGVTADLPTAFDFYRKAAEQGFGPAQFNVGNMYANGLGVKQDFFDAAIWFRQAADRGIAEAQYNLGLAYERGRGVGKDDVAAQRWYRASATQGYVRARYNLALMLEEGRGSAVDVTSAVEFYRAAALQNFAPAQNNLGILLAEGRGGPANLPEAFTWLALAVENGAKPLGRDIVAQQLSPEQLTDATAALAKLRAQVGAQDAAKLTPTVPAAPVAPAPSAPVVTVAESTPPPVPAADAAERQKVAERLSAAETTLEKLRLENVTLRTEKTEAQKQLEELRTQLEKARETSSAGPAESASKQSAEPAGRITHLLRNNERLNAEVKRVTDDLIQVNRQFQEAQEKMVRLQANAALPPAPVADTRGLEQSLARAESALGEATKAREALAAENAALNARTQQLDTELVQIRTAMATAEAEKVRTTETASVTAAETRSALNEALSQLKSLKDKVAQGAESGARIAALEQALSEAGERGRQLARANADLLARHQALAANPSAVELTAGLERKLAEQSAGTERLARANAELTDRLNTLVAERDRLISSQVAQPDENVGKLNAQLDEAARSIVALNAKQESLQQDLQVARQSVAAALAAQAAAANAAPTEAMKLEMQTLQNQVRAFEAQLDDDRKNAAREISSLATQLQTARESNQALAAANRAVLQAKGANDSALRAETEQMENRFRALQGELARSRTEVEAARSEQATWQSNFAEKQKAVEQHAASVAELTELNEKLSGEKTELEKKLIQSRQSSETVGGELAELRKRVAAQDRVSRQQQDWANQVNANHESLTAQVTEGTQQLAAARAENAKLAAAGSAAEALRVEVSDLKARWAETRKSAGQQDALVAGLTQAKEKLARDTESLLSQLGILQAENARLAQSERGRQEAEQRAASLSSAAAQLGVAQREVMNSRAELARLNEAVQALERDRASRVGQLQQENAAVNARLRQAQGTLDQIASAARLMNAGGAPAAATVPAVSASSSYPGPVIRPSMPTRVHVVVEGDTLTRISIRYYGMNNRWQEIYEANREILKGENALRPGQRLRIP